MSDENFTIVEALSAFAQSRDHTLLELAMSWLAAKPEVVSVIAGATTPEQVAQNAASAGWRLGAGELAEIDGLSARAG